MRGDLDAPPSPCLQTSSHTRLNSLNDIEQRVDNRFCVNMAASVDTKLLRQTKFPPEFNQKVDMNKVNVEVMKK